jgi:integrase
MDHVEIDAIASMKELRRRIRQKRKNQCVEEDSFWYNESWTVMSVVEMRDAAKRLLQEAGIDDPKPYHIKHAAVTWLSSQKIPPAWIVRFLRHKQSSTVYFDHYLSEDMRASCNRAIDETGLCDDAASNSASECQQHLRQKEKKHVRRKMV